jgi:hypothetical protein
MSPTFERLANHDLDECADNKYRIKAKPQVVRFTPRPSRRSFGPVSHSGLHRRRNRHYFA